MRKNNEGGSRLAKAALAKSNTVTVNIQGDYEEDRVRFNNLAGHFGVAYNDANQVVYSTTKSNIESNNNHRIATGNPHGMTKSDIGLGAVDNTADLDKPISTDVQNALDLKQDSISGYTGSITVITGVDFDAKTVTTSTINISNGIVDSIS
jgi:hypothetical protein